MSQVFINNHFYEADKAWIGTGDLALQRGYAAFDYFRTVNNQPLFLEDHLDRFFRSAQQMFIHIPLSREEVKEAVYRLISLNNMPESGIRMIATGGYAPDSYTPVEGNFVMQQQALSLPSAEGFEKGVKIMTYSYARDLPKVKSINYLMGIWLQPQLKQKGLDDVLYFNEDRISEFPRANVFIVTRGGDLVTPFGNVLEGITRKKILGLAPVLERDIRVRELKEAAEVFMTSTTKRILPVVEIDGERVGDGKAGALTRQLKEAFIGLEPGR